MLKNKEVEIYLIDVLGYDELIIDELKEVYKPLKTCLSDKELNECIEYNY